ncbi:MAG: terpene cyclase/mutase family protein [bacterium]|nr:terpene cyclase/mutase family protein [bacterium]
MRILILACLLLPAYTLPAEAKDEKPSDIAIAEAIEKGAGWLIKTYGAGFDNKKRHAMPELVLLTLAHAGANQKDPVFKAALEATLTAKLEHTYRVSTMAMALAKLNPFLYRARLAHCAQWLVDTQLADGEWGYPGDLAGNGSKIPKITAPLTDAQAAGGQKSKPFVVVSRFATGGGLEGKGDFSNTQFALLGLRACQEGRIVIPKETWEAAAKYQLSFQHRDGSWGYVMSGEQDQTGYASLTCAGIAGMAICHHGMGKGRPTGNASVKKGLSWLKANWDPAENASVQESSVVGPSDWQYYHLYAVERVGRIVGVKKIGKRDWYAAGATWIISEQRADGSWQEPCRGPGSVARYLHTADTCFAILFLTLSTPPLTR